MKKNRWLLRVIVFGICFVPSLIVSDETNNLEQGYILSFPNSGNTWTRYIVEYLTKHPTKVGQMHIKNHYHPLDLPIGHYFDLNVNLSSPPFLKGHSQRFFNKYTGHTEDRNLPLILVLRNFKECLPRHLKSYAKIVNFLKNEKKYTYHFCENIRYFLKWDPSKRFIIYYEDLVTTPEKVIRNLGEFLKVDLNVVEDFIENYDEHKKNSVQFYDTYMASFTKGNTLYFHERKLKNNQIEEITRLIQKFCPEGQEILQRYYK